MWLSEILAIREESRAGKPGVLGDLCCLSIPWSLLYPSFGFTDAAEGPQNTASGLVLWMEGGRSRIAPGLQAQILLVFGAHGDVC